MRRLNIKPDCSFTPMEAAAAIAHAFTSSELTELKVVPSMPCQEMIEAGAEILCGDRKRAVEVYLAMTAFTMTLNIRPNNSAV